MPQVVIDLASRRVQVLGSTPHPDALFMEQIAPHTDDGPDGMVDAPTLLICDRDRKWSSDVRRRLEQAGIRVLLTPAARTQCERLRGTFRAVDQRRMPGPADSDRGAAFPARWKSTSPITTENGTIRASTVASSRARQSSGWRIASDGPRLGGMLNFYQRAA